MSDPTGSGGAGLLEGLSSGFVGGFGFTEGLRERRRRAKLASDLATLKAMEEQRKAAHEAAEEARAGAVEQRAATTFAGQQAELARALALRQGVAQRLAAGDVAVPTEGILHGVATDQAPQYVPLPSELQETQQTGQLLGGRTEREQLVLGLHPDLARKIPPTPGHYFVNEQGEVTFTAGGTPGHVVQGVRGPARAAPATKPGSVAAAQAAATAGTLDDARRTLEDLERADPGAALMPRSAAAAHGIGKIPIIGGMLGPSGETLAQSQMTPNQQRYRQAADLFTHTYVASLPKARVSPQLIDQIRNTFFPRAGQTDPAVIRQFTEKRREANARIQAALGGAAVELRDLPGYETGARPVRGGAPAQGPHPTATPTTPATPTAEPAIPAPKYNPKFWRKP